MYLFGLGVFCGILFANFDNDNLVKDFREAKSISLLYWCYILQWFMNKLFLFLK